MPTDFDKLRYGVSYARSLKRRFDKYNLPPSRIYNGHFAYQLLILLYKDFTYWKSYKMGLIDENGREIRPAQTKEERKYWNYFTKLVAQLKRDLLRYMNDSRLELIFQKLFLIRENINNNGYISLLEEFLQFCQEKDVDKNLIETVMSGDVASTGSSLVKHKNFDSYLNDMEQTTKDHGHYHYVDINRMGNGRTTETINGKEHEHKIKNFEVLKSNGHEHDIL